ncbi:hypothetical protein CAPTEDRAFT_170020 [Capitella teleta]|uniref:SRCR domain-containing protein n=1 Tax=Capitella teleta TaxID=283909 RepID=R7TJE6_CAPTE|nr:hypothetical protein CAPTEDRAFT_170020 [Capitella teleta]|eukprot:ELT93627.1 hypothetical protein CAPTEDRAFT_170020 [Capitella teleta]
MAQISIPPKDIRLADGWYDDDEQGEIIELAGRVEILMNGEWGTICDHPFNIEEATAVCTTLGFTHGLYMNNLEFGQGKGRVWVMADELSSGVSVQQCSSDYPSDEYDKFGCYCSHYSDAGVTCYNYDGSGEFTEGEVRLADGGSESEGRVEVFHDGLWGTVCYGTFNQKAALIVCRALGYAGGHSVAFGAFPQINHGPIWIGRLGCHGNESSIMECALMNGETAICNHFQDVGVMCHTEAEMRSFPEGEIRLVGGVLAGDGRVEIFHHGTWGTLCSDVFNDDIASEICRARGWRYGFAKFDAHYGAGSGPIWYYDEHCLSDEGTILDCTSIKWGNAYQCYHSHDLGVEYGWYDDDEQGEIIELAGRVEILMNGEWGTICDHPFNIEEATAVCTTLGFT